MKFYDDDDDDKVMIVQEIMFCFMTFKMCIVDPDWVKQGSKIAMVSYQW